MKPIIILLTGIAVILTVPGNVLCDSADELMEQFDNAYESVKPPPGSSVSSDYKLDQTALATLYTTKTLRLIYRQNQEIMAKYDSLIMKYDSIIEQNREIIRLLTIISKKEAGQKPE